MIRLAGMVAFLPPNSNAKPRRKADPNLRAFRLIEDSDRNSVQGRPRGGAVDAGSEPLAHLPKARDDVVEKVAVFAHASLPRVFGPRPRPPEAVTSAAISSPVRNLRASRASAIRSTSARRLRIRASDCA